MRPAALRLSNHLRTYHIFLIKATATKPPQVELKVKEDEIAGIKAEAVRVNKLREAAAKRIKGLEDARAEVDKERDILKQVRGLVGRGNCGFSCSSVFWAGAPWVDRVGGDGVD